MTLWDFLNQYSSALFPILGVMIGAFIGFTGNWILEKGRQRRDDRHYRRDKFFRLTQTLSEAQMIVITLFSDLRNTLQKNQKNYNSENTDTLSEKHTAVRIRRVVYTF